MQATGRRWWHVLLWLGAPAGGPRKDAQVLALIRSHAALDGRPLDHLTDDQLRARVLRLRAHVRACGYACADVARALPAEALGNPPAGPLGTPPAG